ncbi:hypothetical protein J1614_004349 [Plenodomus biglobosus]|nr:hypothetical protein J1614_004349 [Plenodomus biglobosus]
MLLRLHEMRVDAREVTYRRSLIAPDKASLEVVIVATLVSIALLSCLLRVYTRGRLLRTFAFDDGLALVAALCSAGILATFIVLANLGVEDAQGEATSNDGGSTGPWALALSLLHIIGISLVKLSGAFCLLRIFDRRYCRFLLYGLIAFIIPSALTWFGSTLLRCVPVAAAWNQSVSTGAHCMSWETFITFAVINNVINTSTDLILVLLIVPIVFSQSINLKNRAMIIVVACVGFVACAAATLRTKTLFSIWQTGYRTDKVNRQSHFWSTVEITATLIALNMSTLASLAKAVHAILTPERRPPISSPRLQNPPTTHSSIHSRYSSQTVIHRPNTAHLPTLTRFHDTESNLTFDIATQASRTRTQTMQTRSRTHTMRTHTTGHHSRNVSDWSQFSGFTYYTNPSEPPDLAYEREDLTELEEVIRNLGLDKMRNGGSETGEGTHLAVVAMREGTPHERVAEEHRDMEESDLDSDYGDQGGIQLPRTRED